MSKDTNRESTDVIVGGQPITLTAGMRNALRQLQKAYDEDRSVLMSKVNTNVRNRLLKANLIRGSHPSGEFLIITEAGKQVMSRL